MVESDTAVQRDIEAAADATPGRDASARARILIILAGGGENGVTRGDLFKPAKKKDPRARFEEGLRRLVAEGLVEPAPRRRAEAWRLTARGRAAILENPFPASLRGLSGKMLRDVAEVFRAEIARLRPAAAADRGAAEVAPATAGPPSEDEIIEAIAHLEATERFPGRLVPIYRVRRSFGARGAPPGFDRVLWDLSLARKVSILKLNDQREATPETRKDSIIHPFTGALLYFVALPDAGY